jgi:AraC family transcriptional regulator
MLPGAKCFTIFTPEKLLGIMNNQINKDYISRINKVIDFINSNLKNEITLDDLADVANFSKFHFHRIFTSIVGETLSQFILRLRLEKAAGYLYANTDLSITEISITTGFSSVSIFSRQFKKHFKVSPSQWRAAKSNSGKTESNLGTAFSNNSKSFDISSFYIGGVNQNNLWRMNMNKLKDVKVVVKDLPEMTVAYVRNIGPYKGNKKLFEEMYGKIFAWAGARGLLNFPETKALCLYHDDPGITEEAKQRVDVCISVPADTKVDGEIGKEIIPGGKFAVGHFEINADEYQEAWNLICGSWLPQSGYQCDDKPCYELSLNSPKDHPQGKHIIDICVPVRPL